MDATNGADKRFAQLEERRPGVAGGRFVDPGVSGFRLLVSRVGRARAGNVGGGAGEGVDIPVGIGRLDIRDGVFFRDVLVADLRPDHLRRLPAERRVSVVFLRSGRRGAVSGDVCGRVVGAASAVRIPCVSSCAVRVGGDGVSAVLGYGE